MLMKARVIKSRDGYYELNEIIKVETYNGFGVPRFDGINKAGQKVNCLIPKNRLEILEKS